jgi:hypothetical protein
MFIGHFAVGMAGKRLAPKISLGTLFLSAQLLDLIWPVLILTGVEHVRIDPGNTPFTPLDFYDYPISHSLLFSLLWAALFGLIYYLLQRRWAAAGIVAMGVFSHWVLDFISHRPDLPLAPGSHTLFGLGLWYSVPGTVIVEGLLYLAGVWVYLHCTRAQDRIGKWAFWSLVFLLLALWIMNIFSPPPPNVQAVGWAGLIGGLLILPWGYWIDRHRRPRR